MNNIYKSFLDTFRSFKNLNNHAKKNLIFVSINLFLILFSYPIIRSVTDAFFLNLYGAYKSPLVWLYSVIAIALIISVINKFQKTMPTQLIYLYTCLLSASLISLCLALIQSDIQFGAFLMYIFKEAYIVILIHLSLAYITTIIDLKTAKQIYGLIGAVSSLGGITGGLFTKYMIPIIGMNAVLIIGIFTIFIAGFLFLLTTNHQMNITTNKESTKSVSKKEEIDSALSSIKPVYKYVLSICLIVTLSQFLINLINYKFNIIISSQIIKKEDKAQFFGTVYTVINILNLLIQVFLVPNILKFKIKKVHLLIPITYLICFLPCMITNILPVFLISLSFIYVKGVDYSLFNAAKDMLYFSLSDKQKYGAKYVVDMLTYRLSKGIISIGLIFVKNIFIVNILIIIVGLTWIFLIFKTFKKPPNMVAL